MANANSKRSSLNKQSADEPDMFTDLIDLETQLFRIKTLLQVANREIVQDADDPIDTINAVDCVINATLHSVTEAFAVLAAMHKSRAAQKVSREGCQ